MTFAAWPIAAGVAAVAVPLLLILYFLKLRRREVEVSTTLLWRQAVRDLQANAPFQKLRRNLLLFLQLLALAAGLLALAQPEWRTGAAPGGKVVILIDRSASMATTDGGAAGAGGQPADEPVASGASEGSETRLARAKREAKDLVRSLRDATMLDRLFGGGGAAGSGGDDGSGGGGGDQAMVIAFDAGAETLQPFTSEKAALLAAIDAIVPTDAGTNLAEAARLAGAHAAPVLIEGKGLVQAPGAPMHVWTDGRIADLSQVRVNAETPVVYHAVGEASTPNVGIVSMRASRSYDEPSKVSVFVGLQSTDRAPRSVDVELSVSGVVAGVREAKIPGAEPGQGAPGASAPGTPSTAGVVFTLDRSSGATIGARLVSGDALAADDAAWVALPPAMRSSVALVTKGSLYLQAALEGLSLSSLALMTPDQYLALARADGGEGLNAYDAVVFDGWAPSPTEVPEGGRRGRWLTLGVVPSVEGLAASDAGATSEGSVIVDWERPHPALRHAGLEGLYIARSKALAVTGAAKTLARSDAGPVIAEARTKGVSVIAVAFDPGESTWPLDPGFVLFLADALAYLTRDSGAPLESLRTGEVVSVRLPVGAAGATARGPDGAEAALAVGADGSAAFGPARRAGLYTLRWTGAGAPGDAEVGGAHERVVAVNLLSPDESDVGAVASLPMATRTVAAQGGGGAPTRRALWPVAAALALALLMLEWWVYNRRVRV